MNVYFLVEGKTEGKIYPKWIDHLVPELKRVVCASEAIDNNYYLISGGGYPGILDNHLVDSVADINDSEKFDYLVLVIDTDDQTIDEKIFEVEQFVIEQNLNLKQCQLVIIPQVICMETWFLGNKKIFTRADADCSKYAKHYDTSQNDPELMKKYEEYNGTNANFHYDYLKAMLFAKNIKYSKSHPLGVAKPYYINELKNRVKVVPSSLKSLCHLFEFFDDIQVSS